jgi:hypothetical protein
MISLSIRRVPDRCLLAALLFCTVYQSYRYPLQLNTVGMSPNYSDTPAIFQIPKFLVTLLICLITIRYLPKRLLAFRKWALVIPVVCMSAYSIFKAIGAESGSSVVYLDASFWPIATLVLVLCTNAISISTLDRYFRFVFFYALASTAVEVILFLTIGRLPAMAYASSLSVRFGGFLDDPNGFAALLYMLIGWSYYRFSGRKRLLAEAALVICVILTQSFTAIGFMAVLALMLVGKNLILKPKPILLIGISAVFLTILGFVWSSLVEVISTILTMRSGSVDDHLSQVTATKVVTAMDWLFGGPSYIPYESWWVGSLINFGIFWYLLSLGIIAVLIASVLKAFRRPHSVRYKAVMSGVLLLSCYFVLGNVNLPFFRIFPINFLFFLFSYLIFFDRIKEDDLQAGRAHPVVLPAEAFVVRSENSHS